MRDLALPHHICATITLNLACGPEFGTNGLAFLTFKMTLHFQHVLSLHLASRMLSNW